LNDYLPEKRYQAAKTTLADYLDHAKESFLLFDVPIFSYKVTEQLRNPKKIYIIDNGFSNAFLAPKCNQQGRTIFRFYSEKIKSILQQYAQSTQ
jgi:predicted AAA+ superfamily ATPase